MQQEDIVKGSVLIAAFDKRKFYGHTIDKFGGDTCNSIPEMKYHSSFDWIIPVWIKFKNLQIKGVTARHYHKQVCTSFGNGILSGDIENAWSDAVMAISWYNSQTINKQP